MSCYTTKEISIAINMLERCASCMSKNCASCPQEIDHYEIIEMLKEYIGLNSMFVRRN